MIVWQAMQCRNTLKQFLETVKQSTIHQDVKDIASEALQDTDLHKEMHRKMEIVNRLKGMMFESEDWGIVSDRSGVRIQYQAAPGESLYYFKVTTSVKASLFKILAVIYEVDLYSKWLPLLKKADELHMLEKLHKIAHVEVYGVWPVVANRDCVAEGFGVDFEEDDAILVVLQSVDESQPHSFEIPEADGSSVVRTDLKIGGFYVKYLSEEECNVWAILNVDPKLTFLPDWLLNYATGKLLHFLFYYLEKAAQFDDSSPYAERIANNPEVYSLVSRIVDKQIRKSTLNSTNNS
eukprot:TRINITY_DN14985_c0_g3_i3.p1 TRINITY_DN14985_c0_g3~~TRINITY_DN14985_c0_g3_i3.p1  ORF type:complete len:293 (-),score=76.89 TRINITY_DN14985_c0_g3_i3:108-986(-)